MVAVRVSRVSAEIGALAPATAGVTRLDAEVAVKAQGASTGSVRVSRVSMEVLARRQPTAGVTRLDAEVAVKAQGASTGRALVSRLSMEVGARVIRRASVTRLDAEVAVKAQAASAGRVRASRLSMEAGARRGSAGAVSPLAVPAGWEVFLHNWIEEAVLNTRYLTDVSTSATTGAESRRGLVLKPARTLSLLWQVHSSDDNARLRMDRLLVMLRKLTNERGPVPLYMDQRDLDQAYSAADTEIFFDTSKARFFTGARVVIVQLDFCGSYASHSFHIIDSMQDDRLTFATPLGVDVAAGSIVIPMIDCEVSLEAKYKMVTAGNIAVTMQLDEIAGASQLPALKSDMPSNAQTFDNAPIFDYLPDWISGIEKGRIRHGQKYGQGRTERVYTTSERSREWHKLNFTGLRGACAATVRDDVWRVVEFFDTRRGRLRSFWHIDHEQVWEIESIDAGGAFVGVHEINDFADFEAELEGEWIGIEMNDGTMYVREAVTVQQVLTVFRITVDPALPAGLDVNDVVRIARARRTRFMSDELEERWRHSGYMGTNVELIEVLEEHNTEI